MRCFGSGAAPAASARGATSRPTIRVGDTVLAQWGLSRNGYWDERKFHEGLVSAVNEDGSVAVIFSGEFDGWVEPRVPRDRYLWVMLESDRARFEGVDADASVQLPAGSGGS